jgi:hypothetical protein
MKKSFINILAIFSFSLLMADDAPAPDLFNVSAEASMYNTFLFH